jgi:hypothetical protein
LKLLCSLGGLFYIKHKPTGHVLAIDEDMTRVVLSVKKPPGPGINIYNQLWYDDRDTQTIRSALHNLCITVTS